MRNGERSDGSGVFRRKPDGVPGPIHLPGLARTAIRTADPEGRSVTGSARAGPAFFGGSPVASRGPVHLPGLARMAIRTADPEGCRGAAGNGSIPGAVPRLT